MENLKGLPLTRTIVRVALDTPLRRLFDYQPLPPERHAHARAGPRRVTAGARGEVVEETSQRSVERDAKDRRRGQVHPPRVFHNVCG